MIGSFLLNTSILPHVNTTQLLENVSDALCLDVNKNCSHVTMENIVAVHALALIAYAYLKLTYDCLGAEIKDKKIQSLPIIQKKAFLVGVAIGAIISIFFFPIYTLAFALKFVI